MGTGCRRMISILCPTRARPSEFRRMVDSAMQTAHTPDELRILYFLGSDEPLQQHYPKEIKNCMHFIGQPWPAVMASNYLAMKCREFNPDSTLYMVGADDMVFATPEWDRALKESYAQSDSKIQVYSLRDSRDANGTPHPIISREYVMAMGYFLPPIFLHWYVDTWTVEIARSSGCFSHLTDYLLIHDKPSDRGRVDETHQRIRALGWHERDTYVNRTCEHLLGTEKERLRRIMQLQAGTREHFD